KAHAATYAEISWRIAWLKAHYPAEYLAAMCSAGAGFYHVSAYVEEAKRWTEDGRRGIEVRLPSVNHSRLEYSTEPAAAGAATPPVLRRAIRIGLMQVRGLRSETIATLLRERDERGPFRSLEDFLARVPVERDEIETLIKCGAFDDVTDGPSKPSMRPELLWQLSRSLGRLARAHPVAPGVAPAPHAAGPASLPFPNAAPPSAAAPLDAFPLTDYTPELRLRYEQELLEVCVS